MLSHGDTHMDVQNKFGIPMMILAGKKFIWKFYFEAKDQGQTEGMNVCDT